jgi:hypothetical protein
LQTYARYLGLRGQKVVEAYSRSASEPPPPAPPAKMGRVERAVAASRIRDNQRLVIFGAVFLIVLAVLFGVLSRGRSAPAPATLPTTAANPASEQDVEVIVEAAQNVGLSVTRDGLRRAYEMRDGETRTFSAADRIEIVLSDGGAARVTVNGRQLGIPGEPGEPWGAIFTLQSQEILVSPEPVSP